MASAQILQFYNTTKTTTAATATKATTTTTIFKTGTHEKRLQSKSQQQQQEQHEFAFAEGREAGTIVSKRKQFAGKSLSSSSSTQHFGGGVSKNVRTRSKLDEKQTAAAATTTAARATTKTTTLPATRSTAAIVACENQHQEVEKKKTKGCHQQQQQQQQEYNTQEQHQRRQQHRGSSSSSSNNSNNSSVATTVQTLWKTVPKRTPPLRQKSEQQNKQHCYEQQHYEQPQQQQQTGEDDAQATGKRQEQQKRSGSPESAIYELQRTRERGQCRTTIHDDAAAAGEANDNNNNYNNSFSNNNNKKQTKYATMLLEFCALAATVPAQKAANNELAGAAAAMADKTIVVDGDDGDASAAAAVGASSCCRDCGAARENDKIDNSQNGDTIPQGIFKTSCSCQWTNSNSSSNEARKCERATRFGESSNTCCQQTKQQQQIPIQQHQQPHKQEQHEQQQKQQQQQLLQEQIASNANVQHEFAIQSRLSSNDNEAVAAALSPVVVVGVVSTDTAAANVAATLSPRFSTTTATTTATTKTTTSATATATTQTTTTQRNLFYYARELPRLKSHRICDDDNNNNHNNNRNDDDDNFGDNVAANQRLPFAKLLLRHVGARSRRARVALHAVARTFLSLVIIFNTLPLFNAVASKFDASEQGAIGGGGGGGPNAVAHPWMIPPVVAHLEPLPRPTKSPKCDQTFVARIGGPQNGSFSAPLLHNHKNHSRQCLYTFLAGPGQRVEVVFTSFNLRGSPPDGSAVGELPTCVHEYMDIYSEVQSSDPAELINSPFGGRYCGTIPPRRRISMYRAIAISFFTNKNVSTPDLFEGTFRFINASEYEIGIPIAGSPCSYTITPSMSTNKTGALISPTYPGAYPKDMSCTYQFLGEANQRVRLEFRDFDLFFGGPHCPFDYVKVYDGPDNSSALIGTYCGQQRNLVLYSSESSLFVHFYTLSRTANTQNRGFKGIYEFSESFVKLDFIRENDGIHIRGSECDQKILSKKESTGFVLSPNYPYPYIPKTVCRYFIYGMQDAQHLERVRLEFSAFNIPKVEPKDKSESNCTDGYLKIYLKGQETADAYDKFDYELCGNETQRVISDGPRLAMVFSSGELQGRGFKGKYTFETEYKIPGTAAPDGTCSFTYMSSSKKRGELNSPRYPSNYPSETNCSYLFLAETNEQVTIVFDHFKVKADGKANATAGANGSGACFEDWLEMYVVYRDNNDRFLGRYCGLTAPGPVESPRGSVGLRITLHTDQENVASGFKARYFFETAKSDVGDCGGNFSNEDSGIITSPNYPAGYKAPDKGLASMACNWIMTARPGYKLSINFEQFSIEGDPASRGCPAAVLRLWVNVDSDQPPLELCGEKPPVEHWHYISTGQTVRISFTTSDKTVGAQGFRIIWTEIQDSGPGPPSIGLLCESTYHFQCEVGYCISDKLRCDGIKNCGPGDDSDELHCITEAPAEDHGVLIIITLVVVSFLICLLCTLCHSRRKRRNHVRQLGLHRNAHYDSQTSATVGLSSSRRHLQSGGSMSGSLHGINSGTLIIPPAPLPPTSVPPPPHICIAGVDMVGPGGMMLNGDMMDDDDLDDMDDDDIHRDIFINDVRFDEEHLGSLQHLENV